MKNQIIQSVLKVSLMILLMGFSVVSAQQPVDIGLFQADAHTLEVRLRPNSNFNGIVSNIAFTIRWDANSKETLGNVSQVYPEVSYITMAKSGGVIDANGYKYQVFAGFGTLPMSQFQSDWKLNQEMVLMTIPVSGDIQSFELVNDPWTNQVTNNGNFYVSLGGIDRTGVIYQHGTGVATGIKESEKFTVQIFPNPTKDKFSIDAIFKEPADYTIEVVDVKGRKIFREELKDYSGPYTKSLDLKKFASGVYLIKINGADEPFQQEVVKL